MDLRYEKEFFYSGKTGGNPMEIWYICIMGDIIIAAAHCLFSKFQKWIFLRSFFEILFLSLCLYFLVYCQSPFFIMLLIFMFPYFSSKSSLTQQINTIKEKNDKKETDSESILKSDKSFNNKNNQLHDTKINKNIKENHQITSCESPKNKEREKKKRSGSLAITKLDVLFLTAICIIFVDFHYFPPRFAKVSHHYGFIKTNSTSLAFVKTAENTKIFSSSEESKENIFVSLMDTGAAFFVILNGFSSLKPRNSFRDCCINFILWLIRNLTTEATNYYTPEGEYSPGCNFFGYISIVQFFSFVSSILKIPSFIMLFITMIIHEFSNCKYPILGYITLFYLANTVKYYSVKHFFFNYTISILIALSCTIGLIEPLRETANTPFSLFIMSILCCTLDINDVFQIDYDHLSFFMKSIDTHSLFYFLVCNMITGLINIFIDTNNSHYIVCFLSVNMTFIVSSIFTMIYHYVYNKI